MKKPFLVLSLAIILVFTLGACANTGSATETPNATALVPGTGATSIVPGTGATPLPAASTAAPTTANSTAITPIATNPAATALATEAASATPTATNLPGNVAQGATIFTMSNLLGAKITSPSAANTAVNNLNNTSQVFGTIDSFLVDPQSGDIAYALMKPGGDFTDAPEGLVVVPYSALNITSRVFNNNAPFTTVFVDTFTTNLTLQDFQKAPVVKEDNANFTAPNFDTAWRTYYNGLNYQIPALGQNGLIRIKSYDNIFSDTDVVNTAGKDVGNVANIIVDPNKGALTYLVVSDGGFLGAGERYTPIPWQALTYKASPQQFVVDTSAVDFANAPSFNKLDELNKLGPNWQYQYDTFWGITPGAAATPAEGATRLTTTATP